MIIQTIPAAPGDVIVVTVPQTLTQAERDALEARVVALVADTRVLVLDGGMQLAVLKRPDPDAGVLSVTVAGKVQENEIVRKAPPGAGRAIIRADDANGKQLIGRTPDDHGNIEVNVSELTLRQRFVYATGPA